MLFSWSRSVAAAAILSAGLSLAVAPATTVQVTAPSTQAAADPAMNAFVEGLIRQMTLEEKLGQMSQNAWKEPDTVSHDERVRKGEVGSFLFVTDAHEIDRLQHIAMEQSRLHIPLIFGYDVVHGFRTILPVPVAMAASWDPAVVEQAQSVAALEASAAGIRWTFAPMVDIARDARWGRMLEGAGEDTYLGSAMASAQVNGFQGDSGMGPIDSRHIAACVKHFAGYGAVSGGRDYDQVDLSDEQLWNVYLPPFRAAAQTGAATFMTAYMDLNGVPASGNRWLLQDVLRDRWGYQGMVVSDWDTLPNLMVQGYASGEENAAVRGAMAGVDMEMTSTVYRDHLAAAVRAGRVPMEVIDAHVRRILELKYRLGLFQHPYAEQNAVARQTLTAENRTVARNAAIRSAVLLRNENDLLPLNTKMHTLAVIGPLADSRIDTMGSWSLAGHPADTVTIAEGLRQRLGAERVHTSPGVEITRGQMSIFDEQFPEPKPTLTTEAERQAEFAHAIDLVKGADAAVLVLGEAQNMSGERASRASLDLPGDQERLLEAAVATGKPVVLVLLNARPLELRWASEHVPAILDAWYPGTEGGHAVADLLFGDASPGGKLPMSWPRSVGQEPLFYNHTLSQIPDDRGAMYWDESSAPLYPFGYGLSYTHFTIERLRLSKTELRPDGSLEATVRVRNTGSRAGDDVVQLYVHQRFGEASRPVRELKGFQRITLAAGAERDVTLSLRADDLRYWSAARRDWVLDPADFDLWFGDSSTSGEAGRFHVRR